MMAAGLAGFVISSVLCGTGLAMDAFSVSMVHGLRGKTRGISLQAPERRRPGKQVYHFQPAIFGGTAGLRGKTRGVSLQALARRRPGKQVYHFQPAIFGGTTVLRGKNYGISLPTVERRRPALHVIYQIISCSGASSPHAPCGVSRRRSCCGHR